MVMSRSSVNLNTLFSSAILTKGRLSSAHQQKSREKVRVKFGKSSEKVGIIGVKKKG